ncbi:MAG: hypothetical protein WDN26_02870 [Chitinophagaceae bacterium]
MTKINTVVKTTTFVSPSVTEPVRVVTKVDAPVSVKVTDAFPVKVQTTVKPVKSHKSGLKSVKSFAIVVMLQKIHALQQC